MFYQQNYPQLNGKRLENDTKFFTAMIANEQSFKPFVLVASSLPKKPLSGRQKSASMPPKVICRRSSLDQSSVNSLNDCWQRQQHNQRQQQGYTQTSQFYHNYYITASKQKPQCTDKDSDSGFSQMMQILSKRDSCSNAKQRSSNESDNNRTGDISPWFSPSSSAVDSMSFMMTSIPVEDDKKREILKYQTIRKQQKQMIPRVSSAAAKEKKTDTAQLSLKRNPYPQAFLSENKKIKSSLMQLKVDQFLRYPQVQNERQVRMSQQQSDSFRKEANLQALNEGKKRSLSQFLGFDRINTRLQNQNDLGAIIILKKRDSSQQNVISQQEHTNPTDLEEKVKNITQQARKHEQRIINSIAQNTKIQIQKQTFLFQNHNKDSLSCMDQRNSSKSASQSNAINKNEERFFLRNLLSWRLQR